MKSQNSREIRAKLDALYRRQGIHALHFSCSHRHECSSGCANFTEARASLVGDHYGDPCRVVVLSLDPGRGFPKPTNRTAAGVAKLHRKSDPDTFPKNRHWYRTFETVAELLSAVNGESWELRDVAGRFAHVNAAKCTQNLPNNKQAPKRLFDNCRPHLEKELSLLAPDIVITQGKRAAKVLSPWSTGKSTVPTVRIGDRNAYWLELTHPTAWGGAFGKEQRAWPKRFRAAARWLDRKKF